MEMRPSLPKALKQRALDCDIPLYAATEDAISAYLGEASGAAAFKPTNMQAHTLLEEILSNGTKEDSGWITGNLKNFVEAIRSRRAPAESVPHPKTGTG